MDFRKILNNKWLESNSSNVDVSLFALEKLNKLRIFSHDTKYLNLESLNGENKRLINEFTILMNSLDAGTGLYWDDRKFYFEPVTEILHPVFYDGTPKFIVENKLSGDIEISKLHNEFYAETYSLNEQTLIDLETKIKNLDYEKFIFKLDDYFLPFLEIKNNLLLGKINVVSGSHRCVENLLFLKHKSKRSRKRRKSGVEWLRSSPKLNQRCVPR